MLVVLLALLVLLTVLVQLPPVQNRLASLLVESLSDRTGTRISIERIGIRFPKTISLDGVFLEDARGDTLVYAGKIRLNLRMLALLNNKIHVNSLTLETATIQLTRLEPDSLFNYEFLLQALAHDQSGDPNDQQGQLADTGPLQPPLPKDAAVQDQARRFPSISVRKISLKDIRIRYADHHEGMDLRLAFSKFSTSISQLDLAANGFLFGDTFLSDAVLLMETKEPSVPRPDSIPPSASLPDIDLHLTKLDVSGFQFTSKSEGEVFSLVDFGLSAEDLALAEDSLSLLVRQIEGDIPGMLQLKTFSGRLAMGQNGVRAENLLIETGNSMLEAGFFVGLDPMNFAVDELGPQAVDLDLTRFVLGKDLFELIPALGEVMPEGVETAVGSGKMQGTINELSLDAVVLDLPGALAFSVEGTILGLPDAQRLSFDIPGASIQIGRVALQSPLIKGLVPPDIVLPDTIQASLGIQGSLRAFDAELVLVSNLGGVRFEASYQDPGGIPPRYSGTFILDDLESGLLLNQPDLLGRVTATGSVKGTGIDMDTADAVFSLLVEEAMVNGYLFHGLALEGSLADNMIRAGVEYHDDNLSLSAISSFETGSGPPVFKGTWTLDHLNTAALNLTEDTMFLSTMLAADATMSGPDFFDGFVRLENTQLRAGRRNYSLDSLTVVSSSEAVNELGGALYSVHVQSGIFQAAYSGNISPLTVPEIMASHIASYFDLPFEGGTDQEEIQAHPTEMEMVPEKTQIPDHQRFNLEVAVLQSAWYTEVLFPKLQSFQDFSLVAGFDSQTDVLSIDGKLPELTYDGMQLSELSLDLLSDREALVLLLEMPRFEGFGFQFFDVGIEGHFRDNLLGFSVAFNDAQHNPWLQLSGNIRTRDSLFELRFDEALILNREDWTIAPQNSIISGKEALVVEGLIFGRNGSSLSVQSQGTEGEGTPPLGLGFRDFSLENISPGEGAALVGGVVTGEVVLFDLLTSPYFTSDITINGLSYQGDMLGDVHLEVGSQDLLRFDVLSSVKGHGNQFELTGFYQMGDVPVFELDLQLTRLDLGTIEAFTVGALREMEGTATGSLKAEGSPQNPTVSGSIRFVETSFLVDFLNVKYHLTNQSIQFDRSTIRFNQFTLADEAGRTARLDGFLNLADLDAIGFNLDLTSRNFQAMDVPVGQNSLYAGRILISSDLRLRGNVRGPVLEGAITLNEGSFFDMIVPQSGPQAIGAEGVVVFATQGDTLQWPFTGDLPEPDPLVLALRNLDVSVNIEVDPDTDLRIVIDEYAGDFLQVKGGGLLSYGTDPGGRISLTGRYELSEGTYLLTFFDIIRRQFDIQMGSSIQWAGHPANPNVDITAVYNIRTSARELFEQQPQGAEDQALRQQFPFQVLLQMKGSMLSPDIRFEVVLPPEHANALDGRLQARLRELNQNESDRNKQVFALLMLGSFIQDNPFASVGEGPGMSTAARTSASRILSQQLNRMSEKYIRGVEIQFDVQSYEDFMADEPDGRTQLNLEVSKDFFDERLRLTVGGNVELEGESRRETTAADIAGDFSIEYLLNPQGTLILKGFREKDYGDLFDGQVIETGLALQFKKSYNLFRELFLRKEEEQLVPPVSDQETLP